MLTETNILNAYAFCKDDISLIENYDIAISDDKRYVCHHKLGIDVSRYELISKGMYYHRPADELIFLELGEHRRLHTKGKHHSEETKHKMSYAVKGKHLSYKTKQKLSSANKGEKHPQAKQCTINGKTYGCLKDAYEDIKPNIGYCMFTIKYKNNKL